MPKTVPQKYLIVGNFKRNSMVESQPLVARRFQTIHIFNCEIIKSLPKGWVSLRNYQALKKRRQNFQQIL